MFTLLQSAQSKLSGAGISFNSQDRLGRSVLHIAAHLGHNKITKALLKSVEEGGFGADPLIGDEINQRPIHYAIASKNVETFAVILDHLI